MKLVLINEVLADKDFQIQVRAMQDFVPKVLKAWNLPAMEVSTQTPVQEDWRVYITERNRHTGAAGYHTVENDSPVAYCSPRATGIRLFGTYHAPLTSKLGKLLFPARFLNGLSYTISHEIAEMIGDPLLATLAAQDSQGRTWLRELADPVMDSCVTFTDPITKQLVVLADVVLPSFYDVNGKAPFSLANAPIAPFTLSKKGYAYFRDKLGKLIKI